MLQKVEPANDQQLAIIFNSKERWEIKPRNEKDRDEWIQALNTCLEYEKSEAKGELYESRVNTLVTSVGSGSDDSLAGSESESGKVLSFGLKKRENATPKYAIGESETLSDSY